jgi:hypothetical protein
MFRKDFAMQLPNYISVEEVQRVCRELKIRDWTQLKEPKVLPEEARLIASLVKGEAEKISLADFQLGLEVELEHGMMFPDANVTNNHPILTGKIVLAHLKEMLDYYSRLEVAELEGDLLKALVAGNQIKAASYYRRLAEARRHLAEAEQQALSGK